jgi:hypothetical protein
MPNTVLRDTEGKLSERLMTDAIAADDTDRLKYATRQGVDDILCCLLGASDSVMQLEDRCRDVNFELVSGCDEGFWEFGWSVCPQ